MTDDLTHALARLAGYFEPRLRSDPELRAAVAGLARAVAGWADGLPADTPAPPPLTPAAPTTPPPTPPVVAP
ncbi:MAG: hypothetical protein K2X87_03910, partial [Gemmataceae bacterium]|nr:hypothetical protein [Gemmataceae bacterium]